MFQLDDKFLEEVGLSAMSEEQKKPFLRHVYDELELRVGTRLSEGMSEAQLTEFESIIDHNQMTVRAWLEKYMPNYVSDGVFVQLQQSTGLGPEDINLLSDFAATKWLEVNRPDYKDIVAAVLEDLKKEIVGNKQAILG